MIHITRGRALVTVTELGGRGRGVLIALAVAAVLAAGAAARYARTIRETATIAVAVAFGLIVLAVIGGVVMLARRIVAEVRGAREAAPVTYSAAAVMAPERAAVAAPERAAVEPAAVRSLPAARPALPAAPARPAWPHAAPWSTAPEPARRGEP
jgi:hypothetical protein